MVADEFGVGANQLNEDGIRVGGGWMPKMANIIGAVWSKDWEMVEKYCLEAYKNKNLNWMVNKYLKQKYGNYDGGGDGQHYDGDDDDGGGGKSSSSSKGGGKSKKGCGKSKKGGGESQKPIGGFSGVWRGGHQKWDSRSST